MSPSYSKKWKKETTSTDVWFSKNPNELPNFKLAPLNSNVFASYSGPDCGLSFVHKLESVENVTKSLQAGCTKWTLKNRKAYGISMSLYDQHPLNGKISGDPIADSFGLCARENCSIMIVADGVNWGEKSRLAARCAVYGAMKFINEQLFGEKIKSDIYKGEVDKKVDERPSMQEVTNRLDESKVESEVEDEENIKVPIESTEDIFNLLLKSLKEAHQTIIQHQGGLTTLCICFVCPIHDDSQLPPPSPSPSPSPKILASPESSSSPVTSGDEKALPDLLETTIPGFTSSSLPQSPVTIQSPPPPSSLASKKFMACVVNVGDSLAFIFSRRHGVREITTGSHDVTCERDIRDAGGALGPVKIDGRPELNNLTCSMTCVEAGDVVFLATDGITDNFDPVVTKIAVAKKSPTTTTPTMTISTNKFEDVVMDNHKTDDQQPSNEVSEKAAVNEHKHTLNDEKLKSPISDPEKILLEDPQLGLENGKPIMLPYERHRYAIKEMERVLHEFELFTECPCSAQELCGALLQHVLKLTDPKRKVLENPDLYGKKKKMKPEEKQNRDFQITSKLAQSPGKLDHATIIGYEVGCYHGDEDEDYCEDGGADIY